MKYAFDSEWNDKTKEIATTLGYGHVMLEKVSVVRSWGSKARRTITRIHALGKVVMLGMSHQKSFCVIELISENFDKQSEQGKTETIIHELMHIPKTFGGGFRHHDHVCSKNGKNELERYMNLKQGNFGQKPIFSWG